MREIVIEGKESLIDENEDVKYRTKDLPCEKLEGKSFSINKVFLIIKSRVRKPRFSESALNLSHTCDFPEKG